jgi:hypothetical protein
MLMLYVTRLHTIMCSESLIDIWQSQTLEALSQKKKKSKAFHRLSLSTFNFLRMNNATALYPEYVKCECL